MKQDVLSGRIVRWVNVTSLPNIKEKVPLFHGSQRLQDGPFAETTANKVLEKVLEHQNRPLSICFTKSKLNNYLTGGTCSAMSMDFLKKYLNIKKELSYKDRPWSILNRVRKLEKDFKTSSRAFRAVQAALNTIAIVNPYTDHAKDKAQALLNYIDCSIAPAFDEIDLNISPKRCVEEAISFLPLGIYFARALRPAENKKLELYGHSTVFIKEKNFCVFYDPMQGAMAFPHKKSGTIMRKEFNQMNDNWAVTKLRFYRISPQKNKHCIPEFAQAFFSCGAKKRFSA